MNGNRTTHLKYIHAKHTKKAGEKVKRIYVSIECLLLYVLKENKQRITQAQILGKSRLNENQVVRIYLTIKSISWKMKTTLLNSERVFFFRNFIVNPHRLVFGKVWYCEVEPKEMGYFFSKINF